MTGKRLGRKIRTHEGTASCHHLDVEWTAEDSSFWAAGHRLVRPSERSLEPLVETAGDETTMDNPGDDDSGETIAVKSKIQHRIKRLPHTKHVVIIRIAIGAVLMLVALGGQTLTNSVKKQKV